MAVTPLHDVTDWHIRYVAGANKFAWESRTLSEKLPGEWTLVTIDLFEDFGEREIHGIAFTTFDGNAGYFDHVYLGRTVEALDAIDVSGLAGGKPLSLSQAEVEEHLRNLASADASLAFRAFWTLAAADPSVQSQLTNRLKGEVTAVDETRIAGWITQLDDDDFGIREEATRQLISNLSLAHKQVQAELARTKSFEVRYRLETILECRQPELASLQQLETKIRRIVEIIDQRKVK